MSDYRNKYYDMSVVESSDSLYLSKASKSDYCEIKMKVNNFDDGSILIRSKEMAEQLHFMLGQMLDKN